MEKPRKILRTLLLIIGVIFLCAACFWVGKQALQNRRTQETLDALRTSAEATGEAILTENYVDTEPAIPQETTPLPTEKSSSEDADKEDNANETSEESESEVTAAPNPYAHTFTTYPDVAAWLVVPDTGIDYPVVWTPEDENHYLYRDIDGNDDNNGSLILDTDSCVSPLTTNLIIHGHNMRSGAMFGNLTDYEDPDFYKEHKQIVLYTEDSQRTYEVIAVFRSQVYKKKDTVFKYYKFFQADTPEEFENFYQNIKALSLYNTGVTAEFGDRFITLSTCVYHVEQGRFVVVAKEVESSDLHIPMPE